MGAAAAEGLRGAAEPGPTVAMGVPILDAGVCGVPDEAGRGMSTVDPCWPPIDGGPPPAAHTPTPQHRPYIKTKLTSKRSEKISKFLHQ